MQSVFTLGRQPALGLAELESLYGSDAISPLGAHAAVVDVDPQTINFAHLGGSTRLCKLLTYLDTTDWNKITNYLVKTLPEYIEYIPEGKIRLGISYFGNGVSPRTINGAGLTLKKIVKSSGRSVRVVPNTNAELNTAQIIHNQLTGPTGLELVIITDGKRTAITQTVATQDINAYAARDQRRPKRDARVGMLPPKLAQIIINLSGRHGKPPEGSPISQPPHQACLLDPFCGTGVVLQEALLMGYAVYGSDLEPRMVDYSKVNLDWLVSNHSQLGSFKRDLEVGDATSHRWEQPFDGVACETYLGRPLATLPAPEVLSKIIADCDTIHRKFLQNLARQTESGFRACIAVPAWKTSTGFKHLRTLDSLEELGYNRVRFVHVSSNDLVYHRPDQLVARELVMLQRK
jgi:tRNA G10  N-methylase Trm11